MIEFVEWACRTYHYTPDQVLNQIPLAHLAILYRCNVHGSGQCKSGTFQEDDAAIEFAKMMEGKCKAQPT